MYTYVQRPGCKKENMTTYVYIRAGSQKLSRAYVRRGLVFMGRQRNARVHREATERVGANQLGRNEMCGRIHQEGLDGIGDGNEAWRTAERRKRPPTVETGVLLIGRGGAYRKTDEADLCWSAKVETGILFIGRGLAYRKMEETDLLRSKQGSC